MNKPYAESCDQNKQDIFLALKPYLENQSSMLEIGSGTGQHAVFLAEKFPHLKWQTSDLPQYHPGILSWINDSEVNNVSAPIALDVCNTWPDQQFGSLFSANTLHIMSAIQVQCFFKTCGQCLIPNSPLLIYGPFNYDKQYSSESNRRFDGWLKQRDPASGIKDFDWLNTLAKNAGFNFEKDIEMPSNNRILVWRFESELLSK